MKRYIVFMGHDYYPNRAWCDYKGTFDTLDEAMEFVLNKKPTINFPNTYDWHQIVDLTTRIIVK